MQGQSPTNTRGGRFLGVAVNLLFALLFIGLVGGVLAYIALQANGYRFYVIQTGSMEPALREGAVVAVKRTAPHKVKNGDIIAFIKKGLPAPVIHRVTGIESPPDIRSVFLDKDGKEFKTTFTYSPRTFYTRGDANSIPDDEPVAQDNLIGVHKAVVPAPWGTIITALGRGSLFTLGILAGGLFVCWEIVDLTNEMLGRRRGRQRATPAP